MDEKYKEKLRGLEETLVAEELIPPPEDDDDFYNEPSPFLKESQLDVDP